MPESTFRVRKPLRSPARPRDIRLGSFDSPAAAAAGRIQSMAMDLTLDRIAGEFAAFTQSELGPRPSEDQLQVTWRIWSRKHIDRSLGHLARDAAGLRARALLNPAEVVAA